MARHPSNPDPLVNVIVEAKPTEDDQVPVVQPPEVQLGPQEPIPSVHSYRVVQTAPRISINGQLTTLPAGQVISDLGYDIARLTAMGVKLEPVTG